MFSVTRQYNSGKWRYSGLPGPTQALLSAKTIIFSTEFIQEPLWGSTEYKVLSFWYDKVSWKAIILGPSNFVIRIYKFGNFPFWQILLNWMHSALSDKGIIRKLHKIYLSLQHCIEDFSMTNIHITCHINSTTSTITMKKLIVAMNNVLKPNLWKFDSLVYNYVNSYHLICDGINIVRQYWMQQLSFSQRNLNKNFWGNL